MRPSIGIVGQGFVGGSVYSVLSQYENIGTYDIDGTKCNTKSLSELTDQSDIIFVSVPTPMRETGECYTGIVEDILSYIDKYAAGKKTVITKSTVPPGTHTKWNQKYKNLSIVFNPEFLTEANALEDFRAQKYLILGSDQRYKQLAASEAFSLAFPNHSVDYLFCSYEEAEAIKYFRNTFLSVKLSFCNEYYNLCKSLGIDYDLVATIAHKDERLGNSHYKVPGPDGDMGFGGHCFPKDIRALMHLCASDSIDCDMLKAAWNINTKFRKNKDWEAMEGRAVIKEKKI
tara:strand:- start:1384 stop:2244 length:861 start_codon:yes stop_codon:yes gene_type:complete